MANRTIEYLQPDSVEEADWLLNRPDVKTVVRAGGTALTVEALPDIDAVVELHNLQLDFIERSGGLIHIGAMTSLERIRNELSDVANGTLSAAANAVVDAETMSQATLGGMLASGDIHTSLSSLLGALKARIKIYKLAGEAPYWLEMAKQVRIYGGIDGQVLTTVSFRMPDHSDSTVVTYAQDTEPNSPRAIVSAAATLEHTRKSVRVHAVVSGLRTDLVASQEALSLESIEQDAGQIVEYFAGLGGPPSLYLDDDIADTNYRRHAAPNLMEAALKQGLHKLGLV